jgi:hypothetical protein
VLYPQVELSSVYLTVPNNIISNISKNDL